MPIRSACLILVAGLFGAGCGASPPEPETSQAALPVELVTVAESAPVTAPKARPARCDHDAVDACGTLTDAEATRLDAHVISAKKTVLDGRFQDPTAIVELTRLQIWRAVPTPGSDEAMLNAKRAIAVDGDRAEVRLVVAMALARSLFRSDDDSLAVHRLRLHLVQMQAKRAERGNPSPFARAAAGALLGYIALDVGELDEARAAFERVTRSRPDLVTGWIGLGDAGRATSDFDVATHAYTRAQQLAPEDPAIRAALAASERAEPLATGRPWIGSALDALGDGGLAPPPLGSSPCPSAARLHPANKVLCDGVDALTIAKTDHEHDEAAQQIVRGFEDLRQLCVAGDPACGAHVAPAVASAARAFDRAKHIAKSIATYQVLMQGSETLPGAQSLVPTAMLEIADRYYALAIYDQAARFYEQHAKRSGASGANTAVSARARALRAALGDPKAVSQLERGASRARSDPSPLRCSRSVVCAARRLAAEKGWPQMP